MNSLSSKHRAFIALMKKGEDNERRGFELLLQRPDFSVFFDALMEEGLFDPPRNPGPMQVDKPGHYRIAHWPPLPYLEAVANLAGEKADTAIAEKVMSIVRNVSQWRDVDGKPRDNQITWHSFAKILGLLPSSTILRSDLDLVPMWLAGLFDNSVGQALATRTIRKFLASVDPGDWDKACHLLYHLTAIVFAEEGSATETTTPEVQTILKDYWLKELVKATTSEFGKKAGREAADIFLARMTDVFSHKMGGRDTWLVRPAIEDHEQNYEWRGPYNRFVEGLRGTVLAWLDADIDVARQYVVGLLVSGVEIAERVGIHIVDQRFDVLRDMTQSAISIAFFDAGHRHELHNLLEHHFWNLTDEERGEVLENIRNLPTPERGSDSERIRLRNQQNWLKSIVGKGYEPADSWLAAISDAAWRSPRILFLPILIAITECGGASDPRHTTPRNW